MQQEDYPLVLTADDISQIMKVSIKKVYEYAHSKGFPRINGYRRIRVPRDAFFKWLDSTVAKPY
jgi:hypothetical protein